MENFFFKLSTHKDLAYVKGRTHDNLHRLSSKLNLEVRSSLTYTRYRIQNQSRRGK